MIFPIELWQIVLDYSDIVDQIRLIQLCQYFNTKLQVHDFYHIKTKYLSKLTDNIISRYPVKELYITYNSSISDDGIRHLDTLRKLRVEKEKITDYGIELLRL